MSSLVADGPVAALSCRCGRPYASGPDLVVPDDVWVKISPTGDEGGILCPNCIHDALVMAGFPDCSVPAAFTSGPMGDGDYRKPPSTDLRPLPGRSSADPMCINFYCPSSFVCRRFAQEPYRGRRATIFIDPTPDLLGGLLCADFDPAELSPAAPANSVGTERSGVNQTPKEQANDREA